MIVIRSSATLLLGIWLWLAATAAQSQSPAHNTAYSEISYPSGSLRIHTFLYKPDGGGPFPVVIYNHGSRSGRPRSPEPHEYIGRLLTRAGYMVLIPERRGYGASEGPTLGQAIRNDFGQRYVARLEAETDDVLAAIDYLRTLPFADTKRIGIMGFSGGGIATMFAIRRSTAFTVAINQAGGAGVWDISAEMRDALIASAEKATTPTLLMVAQNDRSTESITTLGEIFKKRGMPHRVIVYGPFTPQQASWPGEFNTAPGHELFRAQGTHVWEKDVLEFLARYVGAESTAAPTEAAKAQQ